MNNINKLFNENLRLNYSFVNEQIDYRKFKKQRRKINFKKICRNLTIVTASSILIVFLIPFLIFGIKVENSFKSTYKNYTIQKLNQMENDAFKRLNNVEYPVLDVYKKSYAVSKEYITVQKEFARTITSNMDLAKDNVIYSPLSLYMNLDILSSFTDDTDLINSFNTLLGNDNIRKSNYDNMFKNNYYKVDKGIVMAHNGLFASNEYTFNANLLEELTKKYVEVFQMDYNNENAVNNMLDWVNNKISSEDLFTNKDLQINDDLAFNLFSTLYFKNEWRNSFSKKDTYSDMFYGLNQTTNQEFMTHTYISDVYDYGTYFTFSDYYKNGYSIKYILPKEHDNIHELIKGKNIFEDDETKLFTSESPYTIVELSLPKFRIDYSYDFSSLLKKNGLDFAFDTTRKSFNHMFLNLPNTTNIFLDKVLQKNQIEVNESGTTVKTVTLAAGCGSTMPMRGNTVMAKLNQPFIYIISDSNDLPLYVGSVNNL